MHRVLRALVPGVAVVVGVFLAVPAAAAAQSVPVDSLRARIVVLEERVAELERRIAALETPRSAAGNDRPTLPTGSPLARWRQLRRGMKMSAVRELLGEPARVMAFAGRASWAYEGGGSLTFDSDDRLDGWNEP